MSEESAAPASSTGGGRALSGVERVWLLADRLTPPFVNQLVLEGDGDVDVDGLEAAVQTLASWPVCSARLGGRLRGTRWRAGGAPWRLRRVQGTGWDARSGAGAGFLRDPLPTPRGPLCEVLWVEGPVPRLVLRTAHAFADGRGTLELAAALFATARGESPPPILLTGPTDEDLASTCGRLPERPVPRDCAPARATRLGPAGRSTDPDGAAGASGDGGVGLLWARVTADVSPRDLLPRLAWALGQRADPALRCRVDVPVDLRRHAPAIRSTANLTGLIRLSVDSHRDRPNPVARLEQELQRRLARGEEADFVLALARLRGLPLSLLEREARRRADDRAARGLYGTTANLSNVGRLDLAALSGAGFQARAGFFIPPGSPDLPLFLALTGGPRGVELCGTMPEALGDQAALEALLGELVDDLRGSTP